jgi:hypothetical protein
MFSIIVTTFNRPELLRDALNSIGQQSFKDFEVILVNDNGNPVESLLAECDFLSPISAKAVIAAQPLPVIALCDWPVAVMWPIWTMTTCICLATLKHWLRRWLTTPTLLCTRMRYSLRKR